MSISEVKRQKLASLAIEARAGSYSPYSGFAVGAALLSASGKVYTGANIENASYTPTVCAERVAFFKAISAGEREFCAIAIAGGKATDAPHEEVYPCGVCRQVMAEFCDGDFEIITATEGGYSVSTLSDLLPHSFNKENLS